MKALKITVPLNEGETPVSFASRLAQANGRDRFRDFALDVGIDFQGVVDGHPQSLDRLAALGGCSRSSLAAWAAVIVDDRVTLCGEDIGWRTLRRSRVFVCASCLLRDLENEALEEGVRMWGRATWQVPALRTCAIHGKELSEIANATDPSNLHDFVPLVRSRADELVELERASENRSSSDFEAYVLDRLNRKRSTFGFLDDLPLHAVMRLVENLGAVLVFGPEVRLENLGEADLYAAGVRGFSASSLGEPGIREALNELQGTFFDGGFDWGPRALFGRFYEWLAHENDDPIYDPVRDIVVRHVTEKLPIGPDETICNRPVTARRVHSLHSASKEYGLHPKRLRKLLILEGVIGAEDFGRSDERVLFPVDAVAGRLEELSAALPLKGAGQYLNAPRPHERLLLEAGFIKPSVGGGTDALKDHAILRSDLDEFLTALTASVRDEVTSGYSIPAAARRANCQAMEIVRLLVDRKLTKVGADPTLQGYLSVLVDVDEVKASVRRDDHGGLALRVAETRMGWSTRVLTALIDGGHIPSSKALNPVNRCPQRIVFEDDLSAFDRRYVTLNSLAKEQGVHFRRLKAHLSGRGVNPDPKFDGVPATFYRRDQVEDALAQI